MNKEFELDDIVWGKIGGYPWWPGYVNSKNSSNLYEIVFLSDLTRSFLKPSKIRRFKEFKVKANSKSKELQRSMDLANKVINGKLLLIEAV